uniref:short-chain 2-methylacyl-CoA dehydrogenase n=1 Tax=Albugo laibachii Nc14 TaxID=890382 RepID=F0WZS9_9STRA|nr:acylCoA dehydrogenase putative [Albugo laibachii Nc14]|eukprot:CCA27006.1 acylCoA dehydrogenase putative [Albugo laibachii Nc14]
MSTSLLLSAGRIATKWPRKFSGGKSINERFSSYFLRSKHTTAAPLTVLSEDEELFRDSVAKFARIKVQPKVQEMEKNGKMDDELVKEMFADGIMSIEIPAKFGGSEASFFDVCLAVEELSKVDPSVGVLCDLQNTVINNSLMRFGSMQLKEKYLPQLGKRTIGSFCLTEADSGSDAFSLKTEAKKSPDGSYYTLNGQKMWISNAEYAGLFLVFATVDSSQGYKGITCFFVDRKSEGIEIGKAEDKLGIRASSTCPVYLNNVRVDAENIIGDVGKGYKIAMSTLNEGRIGIASQMLGLAQGVYDQTMPYLFDRHQFGSPVGDFQAAMQLEEKMPATRL